MPKYIVAVETWGDVNYVDWLLNKEFELNPPEIVGNISGTDLKRTLWVNDVKDMVDKVLAAAGNSKIWWLVILGHGRPGWQSVGCGRDSDRSGEKHLYVESNTGRLCGDTEAELSRLKTIFAPKAVVTLGGCETGQGKQGELLLQTVSNILGGITVEAGLRNQVAQIPGIDGPIRSCQGNNCTIYPCSKAEELVLRGLEFSVGQATNLTDWVKTKF